MPSTKLITVTSTYTCLYTTCHTISENLCKISQTFCPVKLHLSDGISKHDINCLHKAGIVVQELIWENTNLAWQRVKRKPGIEFCCLNLIHKVPDYSLNHRADV